MPRALILMSIAIAAPVPLLILAGLQYLMGQSAASFWTHFGNVSASSFGQAYLGAFGGGVGGFFASVYYSRRRPSALKPSR